MAIQAAVGICDTIQLLGPNETEKQAMLALIHQIKAKVPGALCESATNLIQETTAGVCPRRLDLQNIPKAIIGLSRAFQLLEDSLSWEGNYQIFMFCLALVKLGNAHDVHIGQSTVRLMDEVFADMVDIQDHPEYLAQEPRLQATNRINSCGGEFWRPDWDK